MRGAFSLADRKVLVDRSQSGKVRPWREHKLENLQYGDYLQMLHYKKSHRVKECGEVLRFVEDKMVTKIGSDLVLPFPFVSVM